MDIFEQLEKVRERQPLVQCITNIVTVNDCANIILASGGSPTMAMVSTEVEESVEGVQALVCNMGAIDYLESMLLAGRKANCLGIPVVLDPVAAGGTELRRQAARELLSGVHFSVIRGNASEIKALAGLGGIGSGVDVAAEDAISQNNLNENIENFKALANRIGAVIAVSGATDIVTDGEKTYLLHNGCATMTRITGSGCMLTSMIGAFCGAGLGNPLEQAVAAMSVMGIAGQLADRRRIINGTGNATFRNDLIDAVFNMSEENIKELLDYEIYQG